MHSISSFCYHFKYFAYIFGYFGRRYRT